MSITLELPGYLQERAEALAATRGESVEEIDLQALAVYLEPPLGYIPPEVRMEYSVERMRAYCTKRGLDYDALSDEEHDQLINEIVHEARHGAHGGL